MEVKNESIRELSEHESTRVNGGIAFVIPPAVGFAAKVTGISLGITTSSLITILGLRSAHDAIFSDQGQADE